MRVFSFIFILHFVVLLAQPCQDMTTCADEGEVTVSVHITAGEAGTDADLCSPFCICSCCSHPVSGTRFAAASSANDAVVADAAVEYSNPYASSYRNSIWQPPKA